MNITVKMGTHSDRIEQRRNSLKVSENLEREIQDIDDGNALLETEDIVLTIDTSSFLTIICC